MEWLYGGNILIFCGPKALTCWHESGQNGPINTYWNQCLAEWFRSAWHPIL